MQRNRWEKVDGMNSEPDVGMNILCSTVSKIAGPEGTTEKGKKAKQENSTSLCLYRILQRKSSKHTFKTKPQ